MSHLKEPVVINFTVTSLSSNAYVLIHTTPYRFKFNANLYGSYGYIHAVNYPVDDVIYYIRNETTNTTIGRIDINSSTGKIVFNSDASTEISIDAGDTITISSPATNSIGRFGVSLVGER